MTKLESSTPPDINNIVVIGCGLSGMLTALAFASHGIDTTIIESKSISENSFFDDIRTTALTDASKSFLQNISVWDHLKENVGEIKDIYVVDNKAPEMIHFDSNTVGSNAMGYIIRNSEFKKILLDLVTKSDCITLIDSCNYLSIESDKKGGVLNFQDGKSIKFKLLTVCEGPYSKIVKKYFNQITYKNYNQNALTFIVSHDKPHCGTAIEHFMPFGPFAILPLKQSNESSIVWTLEKTQSYIVKNLPLEEFELLVQQNFGNFLGKVKIETHVADYPLKAYLTHQYFHDMVVLLANSAHMIHPLAGQGLNMGIKDIIALTSSVQKHGITSFALEKYQKSRYIDNKAMYLITDNLNLIFSNYSRPLKLLRRAAFSIIDRCAPLKTRLIKYAMGKRLIN